jgi:hypothetical protein
MNKRISKYLCLAIISLMTSSVCFSQTPTRVGTTTANFLEYGFGSAGNAMGDAYVSMANDLSSIYWNPAGLADMNQSEAMFMYQPWLVDINTSFAATGIVLPKMGTLALGIISANYGEMDVTTLAMQEGTGEKFSSNDFAAIFSYGRKLSTWFSLGTSAKFISSSIMHTKASAFAVDFGVIINTHFFSPDGERGNGLNIGMSVSNYGTRMKYDGVDLINPIDILPEEEGNFRDVPGQFRMQEWELPLIFRVGISMNPFVTERQKLTVAIDALHPNNNNESVNTGMEYTLKLTTVSKIFLRGGYKALFMEESQYGFSMGGGMLLNLFGNKALRVDYAYRDIGILGNVSNYTINFMF